MILQTRTFNRKIDSIGIIFSNSNSNSSSLFSSHTLVWAFVLQFLLSTMLVPSYLNHASVYFNQISATIYLRYLLQVEAFTS